VVQADPNSILAFGDCDLDGGSNIFECNNNSGPLDAFITTWDIAPSDIVTIPLQVGTYNFMFNWTLLSDPSIQISGTHTNADGDFVTNFVESGIYYLAIDGEFPHLKGYPADKLLDVIQWGDNIWLSEEDMFRGWQGTSFTAEDIPNLSLATSMEGMFHSAINFTGDISNWDVSNICNMRGLFAHATQFNVDLSSWDVSKVESMDTMFFNADNFNQNISVWDIGNVLTMMGMFKDATVFNQPIGDWDITHVADLSELLAFTTDFNQSLANWIFVQSMNLTGIFEMAIGLDCQNFSSTLMRWNYANPDIINKDLGTSMTLEYDQHTMTAVSEMQARGWTVPGTVSLIDCVPLDVKYWTGELNDKWNIQSNWNPSFVPINCDKVIIPKRINYPIIKTGTAIIQSVQILKDARIEILEGSLNLNFTVQQRLDCGETPVEIYNSANTLLDSLYGKTYAGGLITYLNTVTGTGLVAAPSDQSGAAVWGCYGDYIGGTSEWIGTGQANTDTIVIFCAETGIAAKLCDDLVSGGYEDWFLPSRNELNKLYVNLNQNGLGGFSSGYYWSSTESGNFNAWLKNFSNGNTNFTNKLGNNSVRAVRAF
jgi:surface protein